MRKILPISLIVIGTFLLSGCIFIPTFVQPTVVGRNAWEKVGGPSSKQPLRMGNATLEQTLKLLGSPQYASSDGRQIVYSWQMLDGVYIGLCFPPVIPKLNYRALK